MARPLPKYKAKLLKIAKQKAGNHLLIARRPKGRDGAWWGFTGQSPAASRTGLGSSWWTDGGRGGAGVCPLLPSFWQSESEQRQMLSSAPIISCPSWCLLTSCPKMPGDARDASAQFDPFHYFASPFFFWPGFLSQARGSPPFDHQNQFLSAFPQPKKPKAIFENCYYGSAAKQKLG